VAWLQTALPPRATDRSSTEPEGLPLTSPGLSLADLIQDLGSAEYDQTEHAPVPRPVTLSIPSLGVEGASVIPVGLTGQGDLAVPRPEEVGWYEYSPTPGEAGTSVLAAHLNYRKVPGVFMRLAEVEPGAEVTVDFEDGSQRKFVVNEVQIYDKTALPVDRVWTRRGDPTLALFTCGGRYDRSHHRYEQNVVVFAHPL
jgi:sortase (surface protein transpeptidase)